MRTLAGALHHEGAAAWLDLALSREAAGLKVRKTEAIALIMIELYNFLLTSGNHITREIHEIVILISQHADKELVRALRCRGLYSLKKKCLNE